MTFKRIRQFHGAVALHRFLHRGLRLPRRGADAGVRTVKWLCNPRQAKLRHVVAPTAIADGYWKFDTLPGVEEVLAKSLSAFHAAASDLEAVTARSKKRFLHSVLRDADFLRAPEVMSFMLGRPLDEATGYLGTVPLLSSVRLWWTPPNGSLEDSQLFHCDGEDTKQVKFFVNVLPTTADSGPLTFVGADGSARVKQRISYVSGRVDDDLIDEPVQRLIGPSGSGAAVDTSRCFHYGSRGNSTERLMLMFQFTTFYAPKVQPIRWETPKGMTLSFRQNLALGLT